MVWPIMGWRYGRRNKMEWQVNENGGVGDGPKECWRNIAITLRAIAPTQGQFRAARAIQKSKAEKPLPRESHKPRRPDRRRCSWALAPPFPLRPNYAPVNKHHRSATACFQ